MLRVAPDRENRQVTVGLYCRHRDVEPNTLAFAQGWRDRRKPPLRAHGRTVSRFRSASPRSRWTRQHCSEGATLVPFQVVADSLARRSRISRVA